MERSSCPRSSTPCASALASMASARCETHYYQEDLTMRGSRRWVALVGGLALGGAVMGVAPASAQPPSAERPVQVQAQAPPPAPTPAPAQEAPPPPAGQIEIQTQGPAAAPAVGAEEKGPNAGRVSLLLGADWASAYYFRGIVNYQNGGNNVQPYGEVGFRLLEDMGPLTALVIAPGIWNNWHWGGGDLVQVSDPRFWYEADLFLKLTATWWEVLSTGVTYTYYTSPNSGFTSYADVGLSLSLSDAKWLGAFALNPSLLFAFETKGEALASDGKKGIYMGIGFAPGYTFFEKSAYPLTVATPLTFGFSVKDYYTVNGQNQTFGYFSGGPLLSIPLKFIPASFGSWSLKAGVQFLVLNSNLKAVNTNQGFVPIWSVGLSLTY